MTRLLAALFAVVLAAPAFADERGLDRIRELATKIGTPDSQTYCPVQDASSSTAKRVVFRDAVRAVMAGASDAAPNMSGTLLPTYDSTYDLGSPTYRWDDIFARSMRLSDVASCAAVASDADGDFLCGVPGSGGLGDVVGPASATNNDIACFDGTTGKLIRDCGVNISGLDGGPYAGSNADGGVATTALALNANPSPCGGSLYATDIAADGTLTCSAVTFSDLAGTLPCSQMPVLTGDADSAGGTCTTTVDGLQSGTVAAGFVEWIAMSAPTNPAGSAFRLYNSTLNGAINARDSAGQVYVIPKVKGVDTNEFLTAIGADGTVSNAQPAFTDISGSVTDAQVPDTITVSNASNADTCDSIDCLTFVVGPASATNSDLACFDGATGKLLKDCGPQVVDTDTGITQLTGGVTAGPGSGSQVATVVTNANLTGPITSVGNATSVAAQTGTGSVFVMQASPTLTTPTWTGLASGSSLDLSGTTNTSILTDGGVQTGTSKLITLDQTAFPWWVRSDGTTFEWGKTVTSHLQLTTAALLPATAGGKALGSASLGFASIFLNEPAAGADTAQIIAPTLAADTVITTPNATSTLATLALAETLTNKTMGALTLAGNVTLDGDGTRDLGVGGGNSIGFVYANFLIGQVGAVSTFQFNGTTGLIDYYNSRTPAGMGVVPIWSESISATKTANFTAASYTPPATAGRYIVGAVITATSATNTGTLQVTVDYVNSQGATQTARVLTLIDDAGGTGATRTSAASKEFHTVPKEITINNSATAIVLKVVITGTVSYTVAPYIEQVG